MLKLIVNRDLAHGVVVYFKGNTFDSKDTIKALGYKFGIVGPKTWSKKIPSVNTNMQALLDELKNVEKAFGDLPLCYLGHEMTLSVAIAGIKRSNHLN